MLIDRQRGVPDADGQVFAYQLAHLGERDVLVVLSQGRFTGGSEDRGGQPRPIMQPRRQFDPGHSTRLQILRPARSGQIAARHRLDRHHLQAFDDQCSTRHFGGHLGRDDVIGHQIVQLLEPPHRQLGQDHSLVGNRGVQDVIVGGHVVGCDHQHQARIFQRVEFTHLPGVQQRQTQPGELTHLPSLLAAWPCPVLPARRWRARRPHLPVGRSRVDDGGLGARV